tara:strand:- start:1610 stop:1945 length:336 start_codon:yes stop_codon:yes gene_type:complete
MKLEQGKFCPLIGKDCIQMQCSWFTQVRGMNPNTGEEVDDWSCAITWLPTLMIENSQQQRATGAAIESFRNETVKSTMKAQEIYQRELELKAQERLQQSRQTIHNVTDIQQ